MRPGFTPVPVKVNLQVDTCSMYRFFDQQSGHCTYLAERVFKNKFDELMLEEDIESSLDA